MIMKKKLLITIWFTGLSLILMAQGPNNTGTYYQRAHGKCGAELKTALFEIIKNPSVVLYDSLWVAYQYSDAKPSDGETPIIWDMYSSISAYPVNSTLHGNGEEGVKGFQREHSMPKSWFNPEDRNSSGKLTYKDVRPMYSDIVHVIPTDGTVNNKRSNNAYGEVNDENLVAWYSAENFSKQSKKGGCTVAGWKEQVADFDKKCVFEPNDEYKGDLARIYFYMATCYEDKVGTWTSDMFDLESEDSYQPFAPWASDMLMRWSENDPVSQKERDRNEAIWQLQGNRNPFVDYEGLEHYIWGDKKDFPFDYGGEQPEEQTSDNCDIALNSETLGVDWSVTENFRDYWERTPLTFDKNGVTVTYCYGMEGKNLYADNGHLRLYNYNTLTLIAHHNELTKIEFTITHQDEGKMLLASTGTMDGNIWTGNAEEVQFSSEYVSSKYNAGTKITTHYYVELSDVSVAVANPSGINQLAAEPVYDGYTYTLTGVRVDEGQLHPGIYIRNGRKVIIK